jgi:hypothetical protein
MTLKCQKLPALGICGKKRFFFEKKRERKKASTHTAKKPNSTPKNTHKTHARPRRYNVSVY